MNELPPYQIIFLLMILFGIGQYLYMKNAEKKNYSTDELYRRGLIGTIFFVSFFSTIGLIDSKDLNPNINITNAIIYASIGIMLILKKKTVFYLFPISTITRLIVYSITSGHLNFPVSALIFSATDLLFLYSIFRNSRKLLK